MIYHIIILEHSASTYCDFLVNLNELFSFFSADTWIRNRRSVCSDSHGLHPEHCLGFEAHSHSRCIWLNHLCKSGLWRWKELALEAALQQLGLVPCVTVLCGQVALGGTPSRGKHHVVHCQGMWVYSQPCCSLRVPAHVDAFVLTIHVYSWGHFWYTALWSLKPSISISWFSWS